MAGFNAALQRADVDSGVIWSTFNSMVTANAVVAGASALVGGYSFASKILAFFGIIICIIWFFMIHRQFSYYRYWFASARNFEKQLLHPDVQLISIGDNYGRGLEITIPGDENSMRMDRLASRFSIQRLVKAIIWLFAMAYFAILVAPMPAKRVDADTPAAPKIIPSPAPAQPKPAPKPLTSRGKTP